MMYPRLYLARNLLSNDGMIAVSIDDKECQNLKLLMNEIFGEESFVAQISVVNNLKGRNDCKHIATAHEYLVIYASSDFVSNGTPLSEKQLAEYREKTPEGTAFQWRDLRKRGGADTRSERPNLYFPIYADPQSRKVSLEKSSEFSIEIVPRKSDGTDGCWRWGRTTVAANIADVRAFKVESKEKWNVSYRVFLEKDGEIRAAKPKSVWMGPEFST
jgi:adenine-specific DNA-methyltransferase